MNLRSVFTAGLVAGSLLFGASALAEKPPQTKKPVAQVSIEQTQFGLIIGGSFGGGILTYQGNKYPFQLGGLSLGANIGASKMAAVGNVYDMKRLEDFPGTYVQVDASATLGGGVGGMTLKNENGVLMRLSGTSQGLQLNVGASGVSIYFDKDKK